MNGLLSVSEAQQGLLEVIHSVEASKVPLAQAAGRILAEEICAPIDLPSFANSTVDGFAVQVEDLRYASLEHPKTLRVVGDIAAGEVAQFVLRPGQACRIMTGAPIPQGSDGVVPIEDTDFNIQQTGVTAPAQVSVFRPIRLGENIRPRGQDVKAGKAVMHPGMWLRPQDVGLLAMLGIAEVLVYRRPRVALFSTGDELIPIGMPLAPGKIYDSNAYQLTALVLQYGGEPINLGIVADEAESVESILDQAAQAGVDLILSSAGVSVGAHDYVKSVVEKNGQLSFWRVNMRPGKPLTFGHYRGVPFIGLPGNPVSAFVGFEVFVRPALLKLAGLRAATPVSQRVTLVEPVESDGRESYLRGIVEKREGQWIAHLTGHQGSGNLFSLVQANALLIIPSGVKSLPAGVEVEAWMFDRFFSGL